MKRTFVRTLAAVAIAVAFCSAVASGAAEATPEAKESGCEAAIKKAAAANKHLYIFVYSEDNEATQTVRKPFEAAMAKLRDVAQWVALKKDAAAEKALVERFQLEGVTIPLVIVLAPNGAVTTAGLAENMTEEKLREAIASRCQQQCLKALQEEKTVVLCAYDKNVAADDPSVKAVNEFKADAANAKRVEVLRVDPADPAEARFLKQLEVDTERGLTTMVLAPPRTLLVKFIGPVTRGDLEAALKPACGG